MSPRLRVVLLVILASGYFAVVGPRLAARSRERFTRQEAAPTTGRFIQADDVELFVQESGPPNAPAIVFMHAAGGWSETWRDALDACPARGFHCIAPDLPPLGFSQRPADDDYSLQRQAQRLVALLDALRLKQVVLVGHSFGARATVETAMLAPRRVRALVLVDPALSLDAGAEPPFLIRALLNHPSLRAELSAAVLTNPAFTRRLLTLFVADPAVATPERVAVYQRPLSVKGTARAAVDWLPTLLTTVGSPRSAVRAAYQGLSMPTLLIWGEKDSTTPLEQGRDLQHLIPGARLTVIPKVGHMVPLENPAEFQGRLFDFAGK